MSAKGLAAIRRAQKKRWAKAKKRSGPGSYWDSLTPEERSKEMRRRVAVRRAKAEAKAA